MADDAKRAWNEARIETFEQSTDPDEDIRRSKQTEVSKAVKRLKQHKGSFVLMLIEDEDKSGSRPIELISAIEVMGAPGRNVIEVITLYHELMNNLSGALRQSLERALHAFNPMDVLAALMQVDAEIKKNGKTDDA